MSYLHEAWSVCLQLAPWLLLGALVAGLLHALLPRDFVSRHLGNTHVSSVLKAVLLGIPLPLCSCGVIPAALGLRRDGASKGASIGFMIATPQTGLDSILVSAAFLGWPFAFFKVACALVTGLIGGVATNSVAHDDSGVLPKVATTRHGRATSGHLRALLDYAVNDLLGLIWRWLVAGILVSAAITTWIPDAFFTDTVLTGGLVGLLIVLAASLPLYVCATSSVPIAAALVASGMSPGAAIVFLMAGPASNIATIGAVHRGFGARALAVYLLTLAAGSVACGLLFDSLLAGASGGADAIHDHGGGTHPLRFAVTIVFLACLGYLALRDLQRWWQRPSPRDEGDMLTLEVHGMHCQGCARKVTGILEQQDGITRAFVDVASGSATVHGSPVNLDALLVSLDDAGYPSSFMDTDVR